MKRHAGQPSGQTLCGRSIWRVPIVADALNGGRKDITCQSCMFLNERRIAIAAEMERQRKRILCPTCKGTGRRRER